jgi:hypothetical protein
MLGQYRSGYFRLIQVSTVYVRLIKFRSCGLRLFQVRYLNSGYVNLCQVLVCTGEHRLFQVSSG